MIQPFPNLQITHQPTFKRWIRKRRSKRRLYMMNIQHHYRRVQFLTFRLCSKRLMRSELRSMQHNLHNLHNFQALLFYQSGILLFQNSMTVRH